MVPIIGTNVGTNVGTNQCWNQSSSCQKDVKCQIIKHLDYGGGSQKIKFNIMRFTHIDINFDVTYDAHQKPSKCP